MAYYLKILKKTDAVLSSNYTDTFKKHIGNRGFSLIELMAVIAIIGIVAGFTIPAYISYRNNAKLRGAIVNLNADLQKARFIAIKKNVSVDIVFLSDRSGYTVDTVNRTLPAGVTIQNVNFPSGDWDTAFTGRGIPIDKDHAGDIILANTAGDTSTIRINRFGVIRILNPGE